MRTAMYLTKEFPANSESIAIIETHHWKTYLRMDKSILSISYLLMSNLLVWRDAVAKKIFSLNRVANHHFLYWSNAGERKV